MFSAIGDVWMIESTGGVYLIVGVRDLEHAKGGWIWDMRVLDEPGSRLLAGRCVQMHPEYLEEHLVRVLKAR